MDQRRMGIAAKLLAKAQSTSFDAEAMSLVKGSCMILLRMVTDAETAGSDWRPVEDPVRSSERHLDVTA